MEENFQRLRIRSQNDSLCNTTVQSLRSCSMMYVNSSGCNHEDKCTDLHWLPSSAACTGWPSRRDRGSKSRHKTAGESLQVLWIKGGETHLVVQRGGGEGPRLGTVCGIRHSFGATSRLKILGRECQLRALVSRVGGLKKAASARKVWLVRTLADSELMSRRLPAKANRTITTGSVARSTSCQ